MEGKEAPETELLVKMERPVHCADRELGNDWGSRGFYLVGIIRERNLKFA